MFRQTPRNNLPFVMSGASGVERLWAEASVDCRVVEEQALRLGLLDHPSQGNVGELSLGVTTSYIAVHTWEPYLLHLIVVGSWSSVRIRPERGQKGSSSLVDRNGVKRLVNTRTQRCV